MKKIFLSPILFICLSVVSQGYYGKVSLGYGIPLGGSILTYEEGSGADYEQKVRGRLSAGKGLLADIGAGKMFNQHFGFELNLACVTLNKSRTLVDIPTNYYEKIERYNNFNITPTVKMVIPFNMGEKDFWSRTQLTARFGLVIPIINSGTVEITENDNFTKQKVVNFFDPGFFGAVGLQTPINQKLLVFMEISGQNLNNKIKTSEVTEYTENGVNKLSDLTILELKTEYRRKRLTEDDNQGSNLDPNKPLNKLTYTTPAHNIGVNFGVIYKF